MAITPAVELADFASGIGTAPLQIDNVNDRVGVGTTAPLALLDVASFERTGLTTAVLIRHTGSSHHALRVEDSDHPDFSPFIINSNGRVGIRTDKTDGDTLNVVDGSSTINIKSTSSNNNGSLSFSGRDNSGIAYTSKINARTFGGIDVELDNFASNTRTDSNNYRKLRIFPAGTAETLSQPGVVVAFGGTFRNGSDQVGISSVGIGTLSPLGRFHLETRTGNTDQDCFRIRNNTNGGTPGLLKIENLYDKDVGLVLRNASTNDGSIDDVDNRWFIYNDGGRTDDAQNAFRIASGGAISNKNLILTTGGRVGFGTELPEEAVHIYRNNADLLKIERNGVGNAGIMFSRSASGNADRAVLHCGLADGLMGGEPAFCINNGNDLDASPIFRASETGVSVAGTFAILSSPGGYEDLYLSNSAIITNDGDGAFADRTGSNIDHIWHDDSGSGGTWNFCSDTTYRTTGNSLGQFGTLKCGSSGTLRDNTGQYGSIEITGGNTANYGGYSIEGEAVFMRNATNGIYGLYDDDNNDWAIQATPGGLTGLYHAGTVKMTTRSDGIDVEGQVFANNGTAADPSFSFDSDENTGMFRSGTDTLGFTRNGTQIVKMDGTFQTRATSNSGNFLNTSKSSSNNVYAIRAMRQRADDFTGGTEVFRVRTSGVIQATSATVGTISDERLKENIQDAGSQWDDVKSLRLVNFYWKDHDLAFGGGPEDGKQLGWIAQEVQSVSPLLVDSVEEDYIDNDAHPGFTTTADDGTQEYRAQSAGEYLNLRTSVIYTKAFGALQEAMGRIEILENRLNNAGIAST